MSYDNTNTFALFKNDSMRDGKKDANLTGTLNVEGKEYFINGWTNEKNGKKYISGSINPKRSQPKTVTQPEAPSGANDFDDDLPF